MSRGLIVNVEFPADDYPEYPEATIALNAPSTLKN